MRMIATGLRHTHASIAACFPATWGQHYNRETRLVKTRLEVDLLLNGPAVIAAVKDGCGFYLRVMFPKYHSPKTTRIRFCIVKSTSYLPWDLSDPYMKGYASLEGHAGTCDQHEYGRAVLNLEREYLFLLNPLLVCPVKGMCIIIAIPG